MTEMNEERTKLNEERTKLRAKLKNEGNKTKR
jgi:hypothetical protein